MKHLIHITLIALMCFISLDVAYAGFGITPPYVRNDRLTQGSEYTQKIILVRGDPVEDLKAEITINVPGIDDWFFIDRGTEFILPKGQTQVPMNVTVRVPDNAPFEQFKGSIRVKTVSPDLRSGVSIALGAQIDVDLQIVDEIFDFEVRRVQLFETEQPRSFWWLDYPGRIKFAMKVKNTGNAPVAPTRVKFDIYDKRGSTILETTENTNTISKVKAFESTPVEAFLPTKLPPGAYLVKYSIYLKDEVKRQGELTLSVLPEGTIDGYQGYGFGGLSITDKLSIIVPPVVLLIGIIAAMLITASMRKGDGGSRRRRRKDEEDEYDESYDEEEQMVQERQPARLGRRGDAPNTPIRQHPVNRPARRVAAPPNRGTTRRMPQQPPSAPGRSRGSTDGGVVDLSRRKRE